MSSPLQSSANALPILRLCRILPGLSPRQHAGWRKKWRVTFLTLAWLATTGAQWDALQVIAWGRMILNYSETMSIRSATEKTFAPESSCPLCKLVRTAKHQEQKQEGSLPGETRAAFKQVLYLTPSSVPPGPKTTALVYVLVDAKVISLGRGQPPAPPPKV